MSTTTNSFIAGSLTFGSVPPTSTNQFDDDTYVVTSDGTSTGIPTALYKFDAETNAWVLMPSGGTVCPAPMTRATLIALRTAGGLVKDCDYVVTDFAQGRLLAGTLIHFQAIDASTLSMNVEVKTLFDNVGWAGIYDIDANRFLELRDSIGNIVRDSISTRVTAFDWGNPAYTRCYFEDATVTYTYGLATLTSGLRIINSAANLNRVGGTIIDTTVSDSSVLTLTGANLALNRIKVTNNSTFNALNYTNASATWSDVVVKDISVVTLVGTAIASVARSSIGGNSTFTHNSTAILGVANSQINASTISHTGGSFSISSSEIESLTLTHSGTGAFTSTRSSLANSTVTLSGTGGVSFNVSALSSNALISNASAGLLSFVASTAESSSTVTMLAGSNSNTTLNASRLEGAATIHVLAASTSGTLSIASKNVISGLVSKAGIGSISLTQCHIDGSSSVTLSNARSLTLSGYNGRMGAVVTSNSPTAGTDTISSTDVSQTGRITYTQTGALATTLQTSKISGAGSIFSLSGTTSGGLYRNVEITSNGSVTIANASANFISFGQVVVANGASFTVQNVAVAHAIGQINLTNNARMVVASTTSGAIQYVTMANSCTYNLSGTASCSNVEINGNSTVNHTGGSLFGLFKTMGGVLTIPFNQSNIYHHTSVNTTLTTINNNRGRDLFNNNLV